MKKSVLFLLFACTFSLYTWAVEVHIANPQLWTASMLSPYVGQTITFDVPMFLINSEGTQLSPYCVANSDASNTVVISGAPRIDRPRVYSTNVSARVRQSGDSYSLQYVSGDFDRNTREDILKGPDTTQIDKLGKHTLLVCAANLEYYLVNNFGTGYGPANQRQHDAQREKTKQALALINADIYGLCEVEQGTAALTEICKDLNSAHPNRRYTYVNNNTSSSAGSFTMSAFVYDTMKVRAIGKCQAINTQVLFRKYMQCFEEKANGETFIFSMNHFKAMTGGSDTEQRRIDEANAINSYYEEHKRYCDEADLLIMGDLNCYYGDKPIKILLEDVPRTDLHRYFHPEGSYSYVYKGDANYLDHAISNVTMLPQVTGMQAYHVNSVENDCYTYNGGCNDGSMFRYSDHDPILVGLRLDGTLTNNLAILNYGQNLNIRYGSGGYVRVYDLNGNLLYQKTLDWDDCTITLPDCFHGCFVVHVFHNGKNNVTKYIRP